MSRSSKRSARSAPSCPSDRQPDRVGGVHRAAHRGRVLPDPAYLDELEAEGLHAGEDSVERGLVGQDAGQDGLGGDLLGSEVLEVLDRLGRERPAQMDLEALLSHDEPRSLVGSSLASVPQDAGCRCTRNG